MSLAISKVTTGISPVANDADWNVLKFDCTKASCEPLAENPNVLVK